MTAKTLYQKLVEHNLVKWLSETVALLYASRHLIHEVTSPIAFDEIEQSGGQVRRPELALAVPDHNIPTMGGFDDITDPYSRAQVKALYDNTARWGIEMYPLGNRHQGIVHIVGPEQGFTLPGTVVVCGDSHTATHGAYAALAWGIGTSEVRHVLQTNTLPHAILKTRRIRIEGKLSPDTEAKDAILHVIRQLGASGGNGFAYEFTGSVIEAFNMGERATTSNMSIEGGARIGLVAVDDTTIEWVNRTPKFLALPREVREQAIAYFRTLKSDEGAKFDDEVVIDGSTIEPMVTWGTVSDQSTTIRNGRVPYLSDLPESKRTSATRALEYMGLQEGMSLANIPVTRVFMGSCTNGRPTDFRRAAEFVQGKKVAHNIEAWVVPGSTLTQYLLEQDGTWQIYRDAGFIIRNAGCSSCLAMNDDKIPPGEHCVSTSNRNFENRQGPGARTHLVSPMVAVKTAIAGHITT